MKDLEELRKKHEAEIKNAMLENEIRGKLDDEMKLMSIYVIGDSILQPGKTSVLFGGHITEDRLNKNELGWVLSTFEVTEKTSFTVSHDRKVEMPYKVDIDNSLIMPGVEISWISGDMAVTALTTMAEMSDYLEWSDRKLTNVEIEHYFGKGTLTKKQAETADKFPCHIFCSGTQARYYGGRVRSTCEPMVDTIVEHFKYEYESSLA